MMIEDGFLAPFKVIGITTDIGDGWRPRRGQVDVNGVEIPDRVYTNSDYDYNIIIEDRINQVASEITAYLKSMDRMQKTIVFCANEDHAERMRSALVNLNADMCKENPDYVVRITGSDDYGKKKLDYFISVSAPYPVIATTSQLLSTGADCKMTKLIVLDKMIGSMTEFKQIIGRGTRLREKEGKTHFVVMDFRRVSRLFADPDWDGPIEIDDGFDPEKPPKEPKPPKSPCDEPKEPIAKPIVDANGCPVRIINKMVSVYDADGRLLRQESITDYTKSNIIGEYASLDGFIRHWTAEQKKETIRKLLRERGIDLEAMKVEQGMADVDDFDFICHVAFDAKPLTRRERADNVKKRDFLSRYSDPAREVLEALLNRYMDIGVYEIEKTEILKLDPFRKLGKKAVVPSVFQDANNYMKDGVLLRQVINVIDEIDLSDYEEVHAFGEIYEILLHELQSAGSSGEFYTPRAVTQFMAKMIRPRIGETMADLACGTGGFITSWLNELEPQINTTDDQAKYSASVYGIEKKQFPYILCVTNLLLHGIDEPNVYHGNALTIHNLLDYTSDEGFSVLLMNPPYGGNEKNDVKNYFPADLSSSETADLFLDVMMYRLKPGGRAAVVLPDGFLFGTDNAKLNIKKKLLNDFNLHTVVRLPGSVFSPYTSITTNILFFERTGPTSETWFYRLDMPEGYKHFSKTKPMRLTHFAPVIEWWDDRREMY